MKNQNKDGADDFLKGTPYEVNKGFTPSPMNTAQQFDATETTTSKLDKDIVDFLQGSPYEVLKGFTPRPMPTPEQFNATGIKDTAVGNIEKIRSQATEASPSTDSKNKP